MTDEEFMTHVLCEIAEYAVKNDMEPDDTLRTIANNILQLLEISTFNNSLNLPRNCEFLHLCDDGKLRVDPQENEPYCCDCIIELTGGNNEGSS